MFHFADTVSPKTVNSATPGVMPFGELLAMPENPALAGIGFAIGHIAGVMSDGVIGDRQRIAEGSRRLGSVQRGQRREQERGKEGECVLHVRVIW